MEKRYDLTKELKFVHLKVNDYAKKVCSGLSTVFIYYSIGMLQSTCCSKSHKTIQIIYIFICRYTFMCYFYILTMEQQYGNQVTQEYFADSTTNWPCDLGQLISVCCATVSPSIKQ